MSSSPITLENDWLKDPANARNWSFCKRIYSTTVPSLLCLLVSFNLAMYSPSHSNAQHHFQTTSTLSLLPFSLYVYGLAFGPMIAAPISEVFGRRFIYLVMPPIALLFIMGAGFANNLATLAVCRFLAGLLGSSPLAVGAGTIMDIWAGGQPATRAITLFMTSAFLGPALGSLVGGFVAEYKSWRWSQWTTLFLGAMIWLFGLGAKETYAGPIIRQRAKRLGLPLPPRSIPSGIVGIKFLVTVTLTRPLYMLLFEPAVGLFSLYASFTFSVLFCFLASFPLVFEKVYGFSPGQSGLVFIAVAIGCILGAALLILIDQLVHTKHKLRHGHHSDTPLPPELRLCGAMVGSPLMPIALFWFAWTARPGVHWTAPIFATALFGCANILIFVSGVLYLTGIYGARYSASALAANGFLRYMLGGSFPLFTLAMYNNLGYSWAGSLLGFLGIAFAPLPFVFYRFGERIRKSSAYIS
ncbi:major facilitator superfamily domain-containing protein [Aspergillus pseudoustus]|uniref:Major facilitator superfamily domain-containing protein n=1 Tax=Aspergillus pseudoustus TaxID=1810923 RepID=A0ABR4KUM2_9EURO